MELSKVEQKYADLIHEMEELEEEYRMDSRVRRYKKEPDDYSKKIPKHRYRMGGGEKLTSTIDWATD